jgi:hypothetical protein
MVDVVERDFHSELIEHGKINHEQLLVMNAWREEMWRLRAQLAWEKSAYAEAVAQLAEARDAALEEAAMWIDGSDIADAKDYAFGIRTLKALRT